MKCSGVYQSLQSAGSEQQGYAQPAFNQGGMEEAGGQYGQLQQVQQALILCNSSNSIDH